MLLIENDKYDYDILIQIFILCIFIYIKHILNEIFYVLFDFEHEKTRTRSIFDEEYLNSEAAYSMLE